MKADWRLIILLVLAVVFMASAIHHPVQQEVSIEGSFIAFDKAQVFDIPSIEEECQAPSPIDKMPVF
jgi:hypothetical protein